MKTLIGVASRHGSTRQIADAIGTVLERHGIATDVRDIETVTSLAGYDSVILGSAVYMGRWQPAAREFVQRHGDRLRRRPVWLFSSGPVGTAPTVLPQDLDAMMRRSGSIAHRIFGGRLVKADLGRLDRLIATMVQAEDADSRDWEAIEAWATEVAAAIQVRHADLAA